MIRSSILVREPCGRRWEEKRRTRRQHLAGKPQASSSGRRRRGGRGSARVRRFRGEARAFRRDAPDRARPRENSGRDRGLRRVEARRATHLEGVRFLGGGVVPARLGEHLGAGDEIHGVRGGGLDEREALEIGGGGDGGHGDVRAVGGDARSAGARGDARTRTKKTRRPRNVVCGNERRAKRQIGRKKPRGADRDYGTLVSEK